MRSYLVLVPLLALAACGGSDSPDSADAVPDDVAPPAEDAPDGSEPDSDSSDGSGDAADSTASAAPLEVLLTIPTTNGLAEGIELSPDGTALAHATGGILGEIVLYDLATGAETGRAPAPPAGPVVWTADNGIVGWNPGPTAESDTAVEVIDAATLASTDPTTPSYPNGFVSCQLPFDFDFATDVSSGAVFAAGPVDGGTQVCRLDTATSTVTGVIAPTTRPLPNLLIDGSGDNIAVIDGGALDSEPATAYVYDAASLTGPTTVELPTGAAIGYVGGELVVPVDRFSDQTLGGGVVFDVDVTDTAGDYAFGSDGANVFLMGPSGRTLGTIGAGFPTDVEVSEDGTTAAVVTRDQIVVVRIP